MESARLTADRVAITQLKMLRRGESALSSRTSDPLLNQIRFERTQDDDSVIRPMCNDSLLPAGNRNALLFASRVHIQGPAIDHSRVDTLRCLRARLNICN